MSIVTPLCIATVLASLSSNKAFKVALTKLWGFDEPLDFARTSLTPALSNTALIAPPALTPVPFEAGFINTCEPPNLEDCSWGIVPFKTGIFTKFFFAASIAFAIAVETSLDLPRPIPTILFSSPTTTIAEKPNALPPLVTLTTLWIPTRRSFNSISDDIFTFFIFCWF